MGDYLVVLVTVPEKEAAALARSLVEERLVACVNLVPAVRSIYWWQGKVEDEPEVLCVIKTRRQLFDRLQQRVCQLHSYEVPEVIALPIAAGNPAYLEWISKSTGS